MLIKNFFSFLYKNETITFFRFYNIGDGETFNISSFVNTQSKENFKEFVKKAELSIKSNFYSIDLQINKKKESKILFKCERVDCYAVFFKENELEEHSLYHSNNNIPQMDKIIIKYASKCTDLRADKTSQKISVKMNEVDEIPNYLNIGFANKQRTRKPFTKEQKNFLESRFNEGEISGIKHTAANVALEMMNTFDNDLILVKNKLKVIFQL